MSKALTWTKFSQTEGQFSLQSCFLVKRRCLWTVKTSIINYLSTRYLRRKQVSSLHELTAKACLFSSRQLVIAPEAARLHSLGTFWQPCGRWDSLRQNTMKNISSTCQNKRITHCLIITVKIFTLPSILCKKTITKRRNYLRNVYSIIQGNHHNRYLQICMHCFGGIFL